MGGVRCSRLWSTSQLLRPSVQQLHHSSGICPKSRGDSVVRMWVQLKRWVVSCVWVFQRGHNGDGCDLASTSCKYDLCVLSWARVRRVRWGSLSSELLMCGGGVHSILILPLVARCMYMAHVCFYVCCSDCVGVCGNVCCVAVVVKKKFVLPWRVEVWCAFV